MISLDSGLNWNYSAPPYDEDLMFEEYGTIDKPGTNNLTIRHPSNVLLVTRNPGSLILT
jgi:hypothetical protein